MSELLPRGPILADENGDRADTPDSYERQLLDWTQAATEEAMATAKLNDELNEVQKYIGYLRGEWWDYRRPKYKSRFFSNRLSRARRDAIAQLTDTRPTIEVFSNDRAAYDDTAKILHSIIAYEWQRQRVDLLLGTVIDISKAWGTAFWKIGASAPGILKVTPCGPDQCMPIQPGFGLQQSTAIYYCTWKAVSWIKGKYGRLADGVEQYATLGQESYQEKFLRPNTIPEYTWSGLSPQMQRALGVKLPLNEPGNSQIFKTVEWREYWVDDPAVNESRQPVYVCDPNFRDLRWGYWVRPGERLYPRKRLITMAGRKRIYDGPSPFWHGLFPFAMLRLNPVFYSFWGLSSYRELVPINKAINEIVAGTLDLIKRALNPTAITKEGGVPPNAWKEFFTDMPGAKLRLGPLANPQADVRYMDAPRLPEYVFQMLLQFLSPEFDRTSGNVDITGLGKKNQVPGGETIEQMRDSLQTPMRLEERYVEAFLTESGQQCIPNILQFYNAPQRIRILGENGVTLEDFDLDPSTLVPAEIPNREEFYKVFGFTVAPGSLHSGAKDRSKIMAMSAAAQGLISRRECLRKLEYSDEQIDKIMREMAEEAQAMGAAMGGGRTPRLSRGQRNGGV